jgi:hypothetical protein
VPPVVWRAISSFKWALPRQRGEQLIEDHSGS